MAEPVNIVTLDKAPMNEDWKKLYPGLKKAPPAIGTIVDGTEYRGGDPRSLDKNVWAPVVGDKFLESLKLPEDKKVLVKAIANYEIAPGSQRGGLGSPEVQQLLSLAKRYDPTWTGYNYAQRQQARKDFLGGGIYGRTKVALNTALGHAQHLSEASDELDNTRIPAWNWLKNTVSPLVGDDNRQGVFHQIARNLGNETVKAVTGGEGALEDRRKAEEDYNVNGGRNQQGGAILTTMDLLKPKLDELENAYRLAYGAKAGEKFSFLSPQARQSWTDLQEKYKNVPHANMPNMSAVVGKKPNAPAKAEVPPALPPTNAQGWTLHHDNKGVFAYVSPDGKQAEEVKP